MIASVELKTRETTVAVSARFAAIVEQGIVSFTSLAASVIVGRVCGMHTLGIYTLGWTVLTLLIGAQASLVGTPYTIRVQNLSDVELASYRGASLANLAMVAGASVLIIGVSSAGVFLVTRNSELPTALMAVCAAAPFVMMRDLIRRWAFAHFQPVTALKLTVVAATLQIGALFSAWTYGVLSASVAILGFGLASGLAVYLWWQGQSEPFRWQWSAAQQSIRDDWNLGRGVWAHQLIALLHAYCVLWFSRAYVPEMTGVLAAFVTLASLSNPVMLGWINVATPQFAAANGKPDKTRKLLATTTQKLVVIMSLFSLCYMAVGGNIANVLYGEPTLSNYRILTVLLGCRVIVSAFGVAPHLSLIAAKAPHKSFLCVAIGLISSCIGAYALMPSMGAVGIAAGWLFGMVVETVAFQFAVRSVLRQSRFDGAVCP